MTNLRSQAFSITPVKSIESVKLSIDRKALSFFMCRLQVCLDEVMRASAYVVKQIECFWSRDRSRLNTARTLSRSWVNHSLNGKEFRNIRNRQMPE